MVFNLTLLLFQSNLFVLKLKSHVLNLVLGVLYILFAFECCYLVGVFFPFGWGVSVPSLCVCLLSLLQQCGQIAPRICCLEG